MNTVVAKMPPQSVPKDSNFTGKTAVITGAASGIGAGLARHAARLGMRLVLADIQKEKLEALAAALEADVTTLATDVASADEVGALASCAFKQHDHVDLVFNNAGIVVMGLTWEIDAQRFERQMNVNIGGVFNVLRAFIPRMIASGKPSRMVNTASLAGFMPYPLISLYAASKFAIVGMTEALHYELRMLNAPVEVSLLVPGSVKSEIFFDPRERKSQDSALRAFIEGSLREQDSYAMSADEFAQRTFAGIADGQYWLTPQPEFVDGILPARTDMVLRREQPSLPATPGLPTLEDYGAVFRSRQSRVMS